MRKLFKTVLLICLFFFASPISLAVAKDMLNVSYDPTGALFAEYNIFFAQKWENETGEKLRLLQSHGGSAKQARSVSEGLQADVVSLAISYDIDNIARTSKLLPLNWREQLPHRASPYHSVIVFLVRKGNPKQIHDWGDLIKKDIGIITPNPLSSGGARLNYLAAWGYALKQHNGNEQKAKAFLEEIYRNVVLLDAGARGAAASFLLRHLGDVLITWESEALLALKKMGTEHYEMVYPSVTIQADLPVAVVKKNAKRHQTEAVAKAYLKGLYSNEGQRIIAKHFYRPISEHAAKEVGMTYQQVPSLSVQELGGWDAIQKKHFSAHGMLESIFHTIYGKKSEGNR